MENREIEQQKDILNIIDCELALEISEDFPNGIICNRFSCASKISNLFNQQSKPLLEEIERLKQSNERYQQDYSDLQNRLIKQSEMLKFEHKENVRLQSELKSAKSFGDGESNASSLIEQYDRLNLASTLDLESINLSLYGLIEYRKRVAREFQKSLLSDESKQQLLSVYDACDFKIIQLLSLPNKPKTN